MPIAFIPTLRSTVLVLVTLLTLALVPLPLLFAIYLITGVTPFDLL